MTTPPAATPPTDDADGLTPEQRIRRLVADGVAAQLRIRRTQALEETWVHVTVRIEDDHRNVVVPESVVRWLHGGLDKILHDLISQGLGKRRSSRQCWRSPG